MAKRTMNHAGAYEVLHSVRAQLAVIDAALAEHSVWHPATESGISRLLEQAMKDLESVGDFILEHSRRARLASRFASGRALCVSE